MDVWHFVAFFWGICFANLVSSVWRFIRHGKSTIVMEIHTSELQKCFDNMIKRTDCRNEVDVIRAALPLYDRVVEEQTIGGEPYIHYPDGSVAKVSFSGPDESSNER